MDRQQVNEMLGLTEDDLDREASEYENATWNQKSFGKASPGRPRLYDEDMETVTLRMPRSKILAVEAVAERLGQTRSQFMRDAIDEHILEVG